MSKRTVQVALAIAALLALHVDLDAAPKKRPVRRPVPPPSLRCGDLVGFQVLLDRQGFSPGQIDGKTGANLSHALAAMQAAKKLQPSGQPDCETWKALVGDSAEPTVTLRRDGRGREGAVRKNPPKLADQAKLDPRLPDDGRVDCRAVSHVAGAAGAVESRRADDRRQDDQGSAVRAVRSEHQASTERGGHRHQHQVSREESALRGDAPDGTLVFFAPVSSGGIHDPAAGRLEGDRRRLASVFHYNGSVLGCQAEGRKSVKAGPNSPVGVVWIALNLEHYGCTARPNQRNIRPYRIARLRPALTNWDAARSGGRW
jgi:hypothetical protein